jgi:hypothetical protein
MVFVLWLRQNHPDASIPPINPNIQALGRVVESLLSVAFFYTRQIALSVHRLRERPNLILKRGNLAVQEIVFFLKRRDSLLRIP